MEPQVLKAVGMVAGIGGIAIGTFLLLFREVIRKSIFSKLTKEDSYRLMRWILVLVWSVALAGIIAYVYLEKLERQTVLFYRGSVRDAATRQPISGAEITLLGRPDIAPKKTDDMGSFSFTLETGKFQGKALITQSGYKPWDKILDLSTSVMEEVYLSAEPLRNFELGGQVRDERGGVGGAMISVEGKNLVISSDKNGHFSMEVTGKPGERFGLRVDKVGYHSWTETVGARRDITIILEKK